MSNGSVLSKLNGFSFFDYSGDSGEKKRPAGSSPPASKMENNWEYQVNKKMPRDTRELCNTRKFCRRNKLLTQKLLEADDDRLSGFSYRVDELEIGESSILLLLTQLDQSIYYASQLTANITFYQDGILRVHMKEIDSPLEDRIFRASEFAGVEEDQLRPLLNLKDLITRSEGKIHVRGIYSDDYAEELEYHISLDAFGIDLVSAGETLLTVNPGGNGIKWENSNFFYGRPVQNEQIVLQQEIEKCPICQLIAELNQTDRFGSFSNERYKTPKTGELNIDFKQSVAMTFQFPTRHLYGLPQRSFTFRLPTTETSGPYRLYNQDLFPHSENSMTNLYGSVPYLSGHGSLGDSSVAWMNSGDTWVDIFDSNRDVNGSFVNFVSEAPTMEFFIFGSRLGPERIQKSLADITGYPYMPPAYSLGFHFSKWADVNAEIMKARNRLFTEHNFQVDVFWFDLDHTNNSMYFKFDSVKFPADLHEEMNQQVFQYQRRFVVITDPHIRAVQQNPVFRFGNFLEEQMNFHRHGEASTMQFKDNFTSIWVKEANGIVLTRECWPGKSHWVDFLNENTNKFWHYLMTPEFFNGTNSNYSYWIDMNEPSVFNIPGMTIPSDALHYTVNNKVYQHRDVHNMYGALQHSTAFQGMLKRDSNKYRPFVLTRAYYFGSQKSGAYWTGDNRNSYQEIQSTISMLLTTGIAGIPFGGSDVPSFLGDHTSHTTVNAYQLGIFMPFFRAHSHEDNPVREPWLLPQRDQDAIHAALDLRYQLFPYLYTTFFFSTQSGLPIWRPMYYEYPHDEALWNIESQFMYGSSILVSPKVNQRFLLVDEKISFGQSIMKNNKSTPAYEVNPILPGWYYDWNNKTVLKAGLYQKFLADDEIPMFIKAGTILPLLNVHEVTRCQSLSQCYYNSHTIEIYLSQDQQTDQYAEGMWYTDDGITYKQQGSLFSLVYQNNTLWVTKIQVGDEVKDRTVTKVRLYGLNFENSILKGSDSQNGQEIEGKLIEGGGFEFDSYFSTGNLALLKSVAILQIAVTA